MVKILILLICLGVLFSFLIPFMAFGLHFGTFPWVVDAKDVVEKRLTHLRQQMEFPADVLKDYGHLNLGMDTAKRMAVDRYKKAEETAKIWSLV